MNSSGAEQGQVTGCCEQDNGYSRSNQHYALNCTSPLFNILAPTCFGSSLPS
jgi:hypothetical protein